MFTTYKSHYIKNVTKWILMIAQQKRKNLATNTHGDCETDR